MTLLKDLTFTNTYIRSSIVNILMLQILSVVLSGTRFCRFWRKRCFFHEFLWFDSFFTNFSYSSSFAVILCMGARIWAEAKQERQICVAHAQNYGEWWRVGEIREKLSNQRNSWKKHLFGQKRQNLVANNTTANILDPICSLDRDIYA